MHKFKEKLTYCGAFAIAALTLAGCNNAQASGPEQPELGEIASASQVDDHAPHVDEEISVSENDHVVKEAQEPGQLVSTTGEVLFELGVDSVSSASSCPSRAHDLAETPGSFLVVEVTAKLAAEIADHSDEPANSLFFPLLPETFTIYDDAGTEVLETASLAAWECFSAADLLPVFIGPGETHQGLVVLETTETSGTIAYSPADAPGWQWEF